MDASTEASSGDAVWPSIDDAVPEEQGGPTARKGYNYQDEIAVGFLIDMLEDPTLLRVHCETHDDAVLVRAGSTPGTRCAEYVQVKGGEEDKFWSLADLCERKKGKPGTSLFELSLGRDRYAEISTFRVVTLRPVTKELEPLTFERGMPGRVPTVAGMVTLRAKLSERMPTAASDKKNGSDFWLANCLWDVRYSEAAVRKDNFVRLFSLASAESRTLIKEHIEELLDELRAKAKTAGDAMWHPDPARKVITREALRSWWEKRTVELIEGASVASGGKLAEKMEEAGLPEDVIELALEMRRRYAAEARTPRYLEPEQAERLRDRVQAEVASLRGRHVAGQLDLDGKAFHALCLDRMDAVNAERGTAVEDRSAFLKGFMYDVADRCLLRFAKRT